MATTKQRITISISKDTHRALKALAKHNQVPVATMATKLINMMLNEIYKGKKVFL